MAAVFEKVARLENEEFNLPVRKTEYAAGYDFEVAEDTIVPPYSEIFRALSENIARIAMMDENNHIKDEEGNVVSVKVDPMGLDELGGITKTYNDKPTLVPTGVKCHLDPGTYLELSVRSSAPLKYWLVLANGVGIIDEDYYNNPDNEGEIFFQVINFSPVPIMLHKGDIIGQGIIKKYGIAANDNPEGKRVGGLGSTTKE